MKGMLKHSKMIRKIAKSKIAAGLTLLGLVSSCKNSGNGELIGSQPRNQWFDYDPFGTLFIPMGSYNMGPSDQDVPYSVTAQSKTVSVQAFYMDQTEITNNEYRQFIDWVRDSIAHKILGDAGMEDHLITQNEFGEDLEPPFLNWDMKIDWNNTEERENLLPMFLPENERFYRRKEIDTRKLNFVYYWIDLKKAAKRINRYNKKSAQYDGEARENEVQKWQLGPNSGVSGNQGIETVSGTELIKDRSSFIVKDVINVYPDTLAWISDFTYSFNEPMTSNYFWHAAYDEYPVVGVNWKQARAFCIWRTQLINNFRQANGETFLNEFRLPTESEWEYASRGGLDLNPYPWGGPYVRNWRGCFLGNFKPLRGNYIDDGGFHTVKVATYAPNDFGLYDMAGNVAEWTSNAFDESAYNLSHDLNMDYIYEAREEDENALKRKVIRGGSWKDIAYYMQCGTRTYEYQDSSKCYIGFRCVMTYLGRAKGDGPNNLGN
jgi:formylglycine-generating enzyme required for sulfatase activity